MLSGNTELVCGLEFSFSSIEEIMSSLLLHWVPYLYRLATALRRLETILDNCILWEREAEVMGLHGNTSCPSVMALCSFRARQSTNASR